MGLFKNLFSKNDDPKDVDTEDVDDATEVDEASDAETTETDEGDEYAKEAPRDRADNGPWDDSEEALEANRIDLGSLRVPVLDGMQVQLEAQETSGAIMAVTLVHKGGGLQVQAFAAPKTEGLWKQVRAQISANITAAGGSAKELYTPLGYELSAAVPVKLPDDKVASRAVRFVGVDGPRWFLRGVFSDAAIPEGEVRDELVEAFRKIIVVRGDEPMPPRDVLPLTPPNMEGGKPVEGSGNGDGKDEKDYKDDINPFERGPEIAEVR